MLMSVMGWTNPNQARKYIEKASRAKMAGQAMQMLDSISNIGEFLPLYIALRIRMDPRKWQTHRSAI